MGSKSSLRLRVDSLFDAILARALWRQMPQKPKRRTSQESSGSAAGAASEDAKSAGSGASYKHPSAFFKSERLRSRRVVPFFSSLCVHSFQHSPCWRFFHITLVAFVAATIACAGETSFFYIREIPIRYRNSEYLFFYFLELFARTRLKSALKRPRLLGPKSEQPKTLLTMKI